MPISHSAMRARAAFHLWSVNSLLFQRTQTTLTRSAARHYLAKAREARLAAGLENNVLPARAW